MDPVNAVTLKAVVRPDNRVILCIVRSAIPGKIDCYGSLNLSTGEFTKDSKVRYTSTDVLRVPTREEIGQLSNVMAYKVGYFFEPKRGLVRFPVSELKSGDVVYACDYDDNGEISHEWLVSYKRHEVGGFISFYSCLMPDGVIEVNGMMDAFYWRGMYRPASREERKTLKFATRAAGYEVNVEKREVVSIRQSI